ncbi:MAG: VWA domain-containing protein [Bacteroidales bacterium]|nr:VWA domain-containing protein [Bacteroidales bacterium]
MKNEVFFTALGSMRFAYPQLLWLLLLVAALVAWQIWKRRKMQSTLTLSTTQPMEKAPRTFRYRLRHLPLILRSLTLVFLVLALARPQTSGSRVDAKSYSEGIDIMIALDVSGSMDMMDFKPTRLEACKTIVSEFVDARPNDNIGLVLYAGEAYTLCPPTTDHSYFKELVKSVQREPLQDGTAIGDGLAVSVNHLRNSKSKSKVVILLSDGVNNAGYVDPISADSMAVQFGVKVYTISCGTNGRMAGIRVPGYGIMQVQTELDDALLEKLAAQTGGKHFSAGNEKELRDIYAEIDKLETTRYEQKNVVEWKHEHFVGFLVIALFFFLLEMLSKVVFLRTNP